MYGNVCDWFRGVVSKGLAFGVVAVTLISVTAIDAMAAGEPATVSVVPPNINWGTTAADLIGSLTSVAVVGIGIALSVWALIMIVNLFRRTSSGH